MSPPAKSQQKPIVFVVVLKRSQTRLKIKQQDRVFWIWLSRTWSGWRSTLIIDKPATVIGDMKLEVIVIPVWDVDRAEKFYQRLGWRQDVTPPGSAVFQFTPHGSACPIQFGKNLTSASPGSAQKTYLIVSDIQAVRNSLVDAGVNVGEIFHLTPDGPVAGLDPERGTYRSRAVFSDPDGNSWLLQEITTRLPGRIDTV